MNPQKFLLVLCISASLAMYAPAGSAKPPETPGKAPFRSSQLEVAPGYFLTPIVSDLNFPTAVAFSSERIWVSEAGILPGAPPIVKEVQLNGDTQVVLSATLLPEGQLLGPLTDVTYQEGWLWVTHRQTGANGWMVGAISRFQPDDPVNTFETVLSNLPSSGDHHTNEIIFDDSGRAFFSQGTATNASVVGADNWLVSPWLPDAELFHDFAPTEMVLNGEALPTQAPFPLDPTASLLTAPYMPFGSGPLPAGTVVPAATPLAPQQGIIAGNGSVYSFDPADPAATLTLEGWGLRNPFGIGIDPFDPTSLFVANNGADVRGIQGENATGDFVLLGSRPIANDWDDLFVLTIGGEQEFFGWPDFFHAPTSGEVLPVTDPMFCHSPVATIPCPSFVLESTFRDSLTTQPAFAQLELHSSANKFDFSTERKFKFQGDLFVAETGAFVPVTSAQEFSGYKVVRVDRDTGAVSDFIANRGTTPDELFDPEGFNKPIDVKFWREFMFVVDFGVFEPGLMIQEPNTGKLWLVSHGRARP